MMTSLLLTRLVLVGHNVEEDDKEEGVAPGSQSQLLLLLLMSGQREGVGLGRGWGLQRRRNKCMEEKSD
jgi:hypothetical protein